VLCKQSDCPVASFNPEHDDDARVAVLHAVSSNAPVQTESIDQYRARIDGDSDDECRDNSADCVRCQRLLLRSEVPQHLVDAHTGHAVPANAGYVLPRTKCPLYGCKRTMGRHHVAAHLMKCQHFVVTCSLCTEDYPVTEQKSHRCHEAPEPLKFLEDLKKLSPDNGFFDNRD